MTRAHLADVAVIAATTAALAVDLSLDARFCAGLLAALYAIARIAHVVVQHGQRILDGGEL